MSATAAKHGEAPDREVVGDAFARSQDRQPAPDRHHHRAQHVLGVERVVVPRNADDGADRCGQRDHSSLFRGSDPVADAAGSTVVITIDVRAAKMSNTTSAATSERPSTRGAYLTGAGGLTATAPYPNGSES